MNKHYLFPICIIVHYLLLAGMALGIRPLVMNSILENSQGRKTVTKFDIAKQQGKEGRILWFDATANLETLKTREGVIRILDKCTTVKINTIVVDVKPLSGCVLYRSEIAPRLTEWKGKPYPADYDLLQTVIEEGHRRGLKVHAGLNVFCEGHKLFKIGPVYASHPEWQSTIYTSQGLVPITASPAGYAAMVNPILPEVQQYELDIIQEILLKYDIDGLILDRVRYNGINADFSDFSRKRFEQYLGRKLTRWPEDIYVLNSDSTRTPGKYYRDWIYWRAKNIYEFFKKVRRLVNRTKPSIALGTYAGSWYPSYYEVGVNWASQTYQPNADWTKDWISPRYRKTGYAELLDYFCPGCYYKEITKSELLAKQGRPIGRTEPSMSQAWEQWNCVEGACEMVATAVNDANYVYGTIYVLDYKGNPELFKRAVQMCQQKTNGVGIFDLVYIEEYDWWHILAECFSHPAQAPHDNN
ncbi:MAG: family 10 glycosylhydrolase [bacterium]|nr:family 10 glycosylhydrolase [bacterium]